MGPEEGSRKGFEAVEEVVGEAGPHAMMTETVGGIEISILESATDSTGAENAIGTATEVGTEGTHIGGARPHETFEIVTAMVLLALMPIDHAATPGMAHP